MLGENFQLHMLISLSEAGNLVLSLLNLLASDVLPFLLPPTIIRLSVRYGTELEIIQYHSN